MEAKTVVELTHDDMIEAAEKLADTINSDFYYHDNILKIYAVPRGGISCAYLLINYIEMPVKIVHHPEFADLIIDDIIDSGKTMNKMLSLNPSAAFYALFNAEDYPNNWLSFPSDRALDNSDSGIETELLRLSQHTGLEISEIKTRLGIS